MPKLYTPDNKTLEEIIKLNKENFAKTAIGKRYGLKPHKIESILKSHGVKVNFAKNVTQDEINKCIEVCKDYPNLTLAQIGTIIGREETTVGRILKDNNIQRIAQTSRIYKIDENYFDIIDNENKAYWLGLLFSDGNLSSKEGKYSICLSLKTDDKDIVEEFSQAIYGFNKTLTYESINFYKETQTYSTTLMTSITFFSKIMYESLMSLGCTFRKSHTIQFPPSGKGVPDELMRHFIRGFFDGDGCICLTSGTRGILDITSNKTFLKQLNEYIISKLGFSWNRIYQKNIEKETANMQMSADQRVKSFLDFIYKDSNIYLNRKFDLYLKFLNLLDNKAIKIANKIGNLANYGTTYIHDYIDDEGIEHKLTSEYTKTLDSDQIDKVVDYLFDFYKSNGFPLSVLNDTDLQNKHTILKNKNVSKIEKVNGIIRNDDKTGLEIIKHFSSFYIENKSNKKPSLLSMFDNDIYVKKVLKQKIKEGKLSGDQIREGLLFNDFAYNPTIATVMISKYIYNKYTKNNDVVYDFNVDLGQKLYASMCLENNIKYIGVSSNIQKINSNKNINKYFNGNNIIEQSSSADYKLSENIDFVYSTMPTFGFDYYENDPIKEFADMNEEQYLNWFDKTLININEKLKIDGLMALHMPKDYKFTNKIIEKLTNFKEIEKILIQISQNSKINDENNTHKYEIVYVFKKVD